MTFIGFKIWLIVCAICATTLLAIYLVTMYMERVSRKKMTDSNEWQKHYNRAEMMELFKIMSAGSLLINLVVLSLSLIPFNPKYYGMYEVNGMVVKTESVLAPDGNNYPVVAARIDTLNESVVIDDPRATMIQGESVKLTCERQWVPYAADKIVCDLTEVRSD